MSKVSANHGSSNLKFPGHNISAIGSHSVDGTGGEAQRHQCVAPHGTAVTVAKGPPIGRNQATSQQHPLPRPSLSHQLHQYSQLERQQQQLVDKKIAPQTSLPPRYQPPPQPQQVSGILKNIVGQPSEAEARLEKCRSPEIEVEPNLYLTGAKSSRIVPPRSAANGSRNDIQVQIHPPPRSPGSSTLQPPRSAAADLHRSESQSQLKPAEDELNFLPRSQQQEMLKFVRKTDSGQPSPASSGGGSASGRMSSDQSRQLQNLIQELRVLKETNQRLRDDNQELRDLCCFLDDDRQKGRKLAREWQRFGRYTASVMRQEVSLYQNKLRQLDDKQQALIRDNLELKELCLYLDEERVNALQMQNGHNSVLRDDGDGSSSSTNADDAIPDNLHNFEPNLSELSIRLPNTINEQTLQYVRSLERRIQQLEEEKIRQPTIIAQSLAEPSTERACQVKSMTPTNRTAMSQSNPPQLSASLGSDTRPEAVVRALQVLDVREQLERASGTSSQMDEGEKALIREMCNVVWRKLEETSSEGGLDI